MTAACSETKGTKTDTTPATNPSINRYTITMERGRARRFFCSQLGDLFSAKLTNGRNRYAITIPMTKGTSEAQAM